MNWSSRQLLPTPGVVRVGTSVADYDEFEHVAERHLKSRLLSIINYK